MRDLLKVSLERSRRGYWVIYSLLLLWGVYTLLKLIKNPDASTIFHGINLGIHELGHVIFSPFGEFIEILGGTIAQVSAPIISMLMFLFYQEDLFGASFCLAWLSTNLFSVATYVADARTMSLPLVGLGPNPMHDWNYILSRLGLLNYDYLIANLIRFLGYISLLGFLIIGGMIVTLSLLPSERA